MNNDTPQVFSEDTYDFRHYPGPVLDQDDEFLPDKLRVQPASYRHRRWPPAVAPGPGTKPAPRP